MAELKSQCHLSLRLKVTVRLMISARTRACQCHISKLTLKFNASANQCQSDSRSAVNYDSVKTLKDFKISRSDSIESESGPESGPAPGRTPSPNSIEFAKSRS